MISGFDRYFQIAPCFRDEDARADRSPGEFYQLDVEMSFVTQDDVFAAVEPVLRGVFEEFAGGKPVTPEIPAHSLCRGDRQIRHRQAGFAQSDRHAGRLRDFPRLRLQDFRAHPETSAKAEVWAIPAPGGGSRAFCDRMNSWAQGEGQPGLGYIFFALDNGAVVGRGPVANNLGLEKTETLRAQLGLKDGDAVFFVAGEPAQFRANSPVRRAPRSAKNSAWCRRIASSCAGSSISRCIEWNDEEKKIDFSHNPFSMPNMAVEEFLALDPNDREKILAHQGDPVRHRLQRRRIVVRRDPQSSPRRDEEGVRHRRL